MQIFADSPSDIYTSVSEDDSSSEYSSDSDNVNIRTTTKKMLVIDSDTERENETHSAGECSFPSREMYIEDNISQKSEDFTDVSDVTIECNNPQSISEITELVFGQPK